MEDVQMWHTRLSPNVLLFGSYYILMSPVIYYWTDANQHEIFLGEKQFFLVSNGVVPSWSEIYTRGVQSLWIVKQNFDIVVLMFSNNYSSLASMVLLVQVSQGTSTSLTLVKYLCVKSKYYDTRWVLYRNFRDINFSRSKHQLGKKIQVPDGIRTHNFPWSSRML